MMCERPMIGKRSGASEIVLCVFALVVIVAMCSGCECTTCARYDHANTYEELFAAQVINVDAPSDKTPAQTLPGALASDIYKKRYAASMTADTTGAPSPDASRRTGAW